jgi:hypothetical protein
MLPPPGYVNPAIPPALQSSDVPAVPDRRRTDPEHRSYNLPSVRVAIQHQIPLVIRYENLAVGVM